MEIKLLEVSGVKTALLAMRSPHRSYSQSDTTDFDLANKRFGEKDRKLAMSLITAGDDHSKFMRLIQCYIEIRAARYFWQQFDTYRCGIEKVSESTMFDFTKNKIFSADEFEGGLDERILTILNEQQSFIQQKQLLSESYLQKRIVVASYQALRNIVKARKCHKLEEWQLFVFFCDESNSIQFFIRRGVNGA